MQFCIDCSGNNDMGTDELPAENTNINARIWIVDETVATLAELEKTARSPSPVR
jgi:hypothetical protein